MKERIAVLADVHGSPTALRAVVEDAHRQGASSYWFVGDLLMPGPGVAAVWNQLQALRPTLIVRGNWDDLVINGARGVMKPTKPSHVYFARLAQYVAAHAPAGMVDAMAAWPLQASRQVGPLNFVVSHNLPNHNFGQALFPTQPTANFDQLLTGDGLAGRADVAIYAHVHHQLLRYATDERLILNPGSVAEPFNRQLRLQADLRAQYLLLTVDDQGLGGLDFRRVAYDREADWQLAKNQELPYLALYRRQLDSGRVDTHNQELLDQVNRKHGYAAQYAAYARKVRKSE